MKPKPVVGQVLVGGDQCNKKKKEAYSGPNLPVCSGLEYRFSQETCSSGASELDYNNAVKYAGRKSFVYNTYIP